MNIKVRFITLFVLMFFCVSILSAAINGENKFLVVKDVPSSEIPLGLYDVEALPDLNNNGLEEILVIADVGGGGDGSAAFILERKANNELQKVWEYYHYESYYSYGVAYGDVDNDGWLEIIMLASADPGQSGIVFFEVDSTMIGSENYPLPSEPTYMFDITGTGAGQGVYQAAVGNVDTDPQNELIVTDYEYYKLYVLEDLNGDISNPNWHYEMIDTNFTGAVTAVTIGDFDNDGFRDFAVAARPDCKLRIYENTGDEDVYEVRFDRDLSPGGLSAFRSLTYYDFNGDFHQELIYPTYDDYGKVFIIDNPGELAAMDSTNIHQIAELNGRLTGCITGNQEFTPSAAVYDGRDIYISDRDNGKVYDIEYIGSDGVFDAADPNNYMMYTIYSNMGATPRGVAVHKLGKSPDFDGDGRGDLVVIGTGGSSYVHMLEHEPANQLGLNIAYQDPPTATHPDDPIDSNPRGSVANVDLDQDGKQEIYITQYTGEIHCYEATGNDNELEWIWSDTLGKSVGLSSSPRDFAAGDIDGNGRWEIYYWTASNTDLHPDSAGLWFYEWDGVNDNGIGQSGGVPYAGGPTYIYPQNLIDPRITKGYTAEYFDAGDVDMDGKTEVIMANNGSGSDADGCFVLHCVDGTLEDGFPTFKAEVWMRPDMAWGGSPWGSAFGGDTDGDGHKEAIFMIWDNLILFFVEYISEDSVEIFQSPKLDTLGGDAVFYNNIGIGDLDGDGDDEIISLNYSGPNRVFVINPPAGDLSQLDPYNPNHITTIPVAGSFGGELGDPNRDGKWDLMFAEYRRSKITALTLNGTDPMDANSWITSEAFYDDSWVPKPTIFDYDTTTGTHPTDPAQSEYDYYLYHWDDGVHSLTDGSFAIKQLSDYDGDGELEIWINTIQSPFSDSWFVIAEATDVGIKVSPWKVIKPEDYKLEDAYPNPFNAITTIRYSLPLDKNVNIKIYNMLGQVVKTVVDNEFQYKGEHKVTWDGTNDQGFSVASGTYVYTLEVGKHVRHSKRMTLVK